MLEAVRLSTLTYPLCGGDFCANADTECKQACLIRKNTTLGYTKQNTVIVCCLVAQQLNACVERGTALSVTVDAGRVKHICSWCGESASKMLKCPCERARYCNAACQAQHWLLHRETHSPK